MSYWKLCAWTRVPSPQPLCLPDLFPSPGAPLCSFGSPCSFPHASRYFLLPVCPCVSHTVSSACLSLPQPFLTSCLPLAQLFSSSRKRSECLNCAISSSPGSSSAPGVTLRHPQTPRGPCPGGPLSPPTGLAVMGVESTCFTSEGGVRGDRPIGGGRGRGRRGGGLGGSRGYQPQVGRTLLHPISCKYLPLCKPRGFLGLQYSRSQALFSHSFI